MRPIRMNRPELHRTPIVAAWTMTADDSITPCPTCGMELYTGVNVCYVCGGSTGAGATPVPHNHPSEQHSGPQLSPAPTHRRSTAGSDGRTRNGALVRE